MTQMYFPKSGFPLNKKLNPSHKICVPGGCPWQNQWIYCGTDTLLDKSMLQMSVQYDICLTVCAKFTQSPLQKYYLQEHD